ncbi:MAG: hypothetical protein LUC93_01685 [Planctomycetaceae bacterium]|nr:hypothetical protein [Planctomycetaceae bacterium]
MRRLCREDAMRILASFKIVRDIDQLAPSELVALRDGTLDLNVFKTIIGGYDEAALENALRLRDAIQKSGGDAEVHAATAGECDDRFARDLFALGITRIFRIAPQQEGPADIPETVASALAELVTAQGGYDAVFMGRQTSPEEHGQTPFLLGAMTGLPCLAETLDLNYGEDGIVARSRTDAGTATRTVTRPAIYVMGEAFHPYLRIATLREKLKAGERTVDDFVPPPPSYRMEKPRLLRRIYEFSEKTCVFIDGVTLDEKVDKLWHDHLREAVER